MSGPSGVLVVGDVINDILVKARTTVAHATDNPATIVRRPGGCAANQAAWLGHLGGTVAFAGRAGHLDADAHASRLRDHGVTPCIVGDRNAETGTIVVLVDSAGERTMYVDRGANLRLSRADLPDRLLDDVGLVHLTGFSLFTPGTRAAVADLLARALRRGLPYSIDPGSVGFLRQADPENFLAWSAGAEVCFPNLAEARVLTGLHAPDEAAVALARHYRNVVVTLGADGAVVRANGEPPVTVPARPVDVIDTTGAGDAFCAAFLRHWTDGRGAVEAAERAVEVAADCAGRLGARPPEPAR